MLSDAPVSGKIYEATHAGCDVYEMGSGKLGISVGEVTAVFDPTSSLLRYTCEAPPPLMLTGSGRALALPSTPKDFVLTLSRGTSCFFYAHGVTPPVAAVERLAADSTLNATRVGATLAIHHIERPDSNREFLEFSAHPICATLAREAARLFAERHGVRGEQGYELSVAVGEAVANAVEYSTGQDATFSVDCLFDGDRIHVHVENAGDWRMSVPSEERGRGLPMMTACSRALEIASKDARTRISLTF